MDTGGPFRATVSPRLACYWEIAWARRSLGRRRVTSRPSKGRSYKLDSQEEVSNSMPSNFRNSRPILRFTRRQFNTQTLAFLGAAAFPVAASSSPGKEQELRGITGITKNSAFLSVPPSTPAGQTWRYGLAAPFQIASRKGAIFYNIRAAYSPGGDWE